MKEYSCPSCRQRRWSADEIPYASIERDLVREDLHLFYLLASASFVEITSNLYTQNLLEYFFEDAEVRHWLEAHWQLEEVQHGIALRGYVNSVWPEFDWGRAYRCFYAEYSRFCRAARLGPTPALEMVSRCLVETGTATLYTMLYQIANEPVLRILTAHIRSDEARHYKYFYRFFLRYSRLEPPGRRPVLRALVSRIGEIDSEDAYCAFKHVFEARHPGRCFLDSDYKAFRKYYGALARRHYPYEMAVKMFLKPLGLNRWAKRAAVPLLLAGARHLCR